MSDHVGTGPGSMSEKRGARRVAFAHAPSTSIMAIDGTWRRPCVLSDVSDTGAKLTIQGPLKGLNLSEFFLVLSSTGLAYRRCSFVWTRKNQIGVAFDKQEVKK
jgi:hypothetical protein